jgi:hypothetical protein
MRSLRANRGEVVTEGGTDKDGKRSVLSVMAGLVPAIHVFAISIGLMVRSGRRPRLEHPKSALADLGIYYADLG